MTDLVEFNVGDAAPLHIKAADSMQYCFACGRKIGNNAWYFEVDSGWMLIDPNVRHLNNSDSQGCFPVGVECAKKFNPSLLVKLSA
jgi:hypothetical protein